MSLFKQNLYEISSYMDIIHNYLNILLKRQSLLFWLLRGKESQQLTTVET